MDILIEDLNRIIEATFITEPSYPGINSDSKLVKFIDICENFNSVADLQKIEFKIKDPLIPRIYDYTFKGKDLRKWEQVLEFAEDTDSDPKMSYDTKGDRWKLSEFVLHRSVRDEIVYLFTHCTLHYFKIAWS